MKNDITALTDQITSALNDFADSASKQGRRGYKEARSNVDGMMSDLQERGLSAAESAYDAAISLEENLEEAIAERPLVTVGIAVALGFLIGVTWRK